VGKRDFTTFAPPLKKIWKNPLVPFPGQNSSDTYVRTCAHDYTLLDARFNIESLQPPCWMACCIPYFLLTAQAESVLHDYLRPKGLCE